MPITLTELAVSVSIVGILSGIALPSYLAVREWAEKDIKCSARLSEINRRLIDKAAYAGTYAEFLGSTSRRQKVTERRPAIPFKVNPEVVGNSTTYLAVYIPELEKWFHTQMETGSEESVRIAYPVLGDSVDNNKCFAVSVQKGSSNHPAFLNADENGGLDSFVGESIGTFLIDLEKPESLLGWSF